MKVEKPSNTSYRMPWWSSLLLAICSYIFFKYAAPTLNLQHPVLQELCKASPTFAPIITIPFLLLAAKQLYDGDTNGEDKEDPPDDPENKAANPDDRENKTE